MKFHFLLQNWKINKNWFCMYIYWGTIQETIDIRMTSSGSKWKTGNFARFCRECTTKLKINFLFHIGYGTIKRNGVALMMVIQDSRINRLYNVKLWKHMNDGHFSMMLLGVYYRVENPFPVSHRKCNYRKNWVCNCNTEFKRKCNEKCLALEVN